MEAEPTSLTPRAGTVAAVTDTEAVFQMVAEHSLDGVIVGHPSGDILYANPAACEMLRATAEQLRQVGRHGLTDIRDPAWQAMAEERALTGRTRGVARMRRADGTSFLADVSSAVFTTPAGEERTCVMLRDVTAHVFSERNLAAYNEVVEALLAGCPVEAVLQAIARHARIIFDATDASVVTPAGPPHDVAVIAADGPLSSQMLGRGYPVGSLARRVMERKEPVLVEDLEAEAPFEDGRRIGAGAAVLAPILAGAEVYGVLFVGVTSDGRVYHAEDVELIAAYALRTGLVIAMAESRTAAERQQRQVNAQLQEALHTRVVIEQAKGVLSVTRHLSPDEAFQRLRAYARSHNRTVHSVARAVVERRLMI